MQMEHHNVADPYSGYGTEGETVYKKPTAILMGHRRRMDLVSICENLFAPWVMFSVVYAAMSFDSHFRYPIETYVFVGLCLVLVFYCGWKAYNAWRSTQSGQYLHPTWYIFLFVQMALGWGLGVFLGSLNFTINMHQFYDWANMTFYPSLNPITTSGQQVMDAARVYFFKNCAMDLSLAMAFKDDDTYCAAPISCTGKSPASYDYWAVGLNCCNSDGTGFTCSNTDNTKAHAGLRLLNDQQRPFFRLAVQQAEAQYQLTAIHPLFFYWVEDPTAAMNEAMYSGYKWYMGGMFLFFGYCVVAVFAAAWSFSKLGFV